MAQTVKWTTPEATATALSTGLDALANATLSAVSGIVDNLTDLYRTISFEVALASLTPTSGGYVAVHIEYSLDDTNYADNNLAHFQNVIVTLALDTAVGAKRVVSGPIPIGPFKFKLALENRAGVALGATGNTLKYRRFNEQST